MTEELGKTPHPGTSGADPELDETVLEEEVLYDGRIIRLEKWQVRLPNGRTALREVVRHPGAVGILAAPDANHIILVEQYRAPTGEILLEIPAGKLDAQEHPVDCAYRELREETGYVAGRMEHMFEFFTSPGFADEKINLFYATDLTPGPEQPDDDEFVRMRPWEREELESAVARGQVRDAKTLVALHWWLLQKQTGRR